MKKINYNYILLGITIFIMFAIIVFIIFADWKDIEPTEPTEPKIEQLREEYLFKYSKQIKEVQENINEKQNKINDLEKDIKQLWGQENQLKECLWANSMSGAVVDCDLYFNKPKNEEEGSASGSDANKVSE